MINTTLSLADGPALSALTLDRGARLVVLLHGWTCRAADWRGFLDGTRAQARFVAPDLPGHGTCPVEISDWSVHGLAEAVAGLVPDADREDVILVGHSMGGAVALEAAALLGCTAGVVLVDTFVIPYGDLAEKDAAAIEKGFQEDFPAAIDRLVETNTSSSMSAEAKAKLAAAMKQANPEWMLPLWSDLLRWDPEPAFETVKAPIHAINGGMISEMARARCRSRLTEHLLEGAGHFPQFEMPAAFNRTLDGVLEGLGR